MNIGCVSKGLAIAIALGLFGYFVGPMVGLNQDIPVGSVLASGLMFGFLLGAWMFGTKGSSASKTKHDNTNVLYVGNIPFKAREEEVQRLFEAYGSVASVRLVRGGPSRRPKGYGFVEMATAGDVKAALALNGEEFAGRKLRVNEAKDKN
ncbi:MAG TPA: RNA-binding protein [Ghiorsea sp.]|nr:RNA-binding protein [Ghiorsea sp.]HIP07250.1 RNA-binding protein [Mariprofundaceae bacterium]